MDGARFVIPRLSDSLLLQPCDIQPSQSGWEVIGVFNPAVAIVGDERVILARVAERPIEKRPGWTALPYWSGAEAKVDWVRDEDLRQTDARVVALKSSGDLRLTSVSHLQSFRQDHDPARQRGTDLATIPRSHVESGNADAGTTIGMSMLRPRGDSIMPEEAYEQYGIEDPRITKIDDTYWITYVAVSRFGAATALMSSTDLVTFRRHGIVFPSENKDVVLFPQRINDDYVALHRPNPCSHFSPPQIWIARSPDLIHWGRHEPIVSGVEPWESDRVGTGTPPVLIDEGWLVLYHGSETSKVAGTVGRYAAGAFLLDRDDPSRVLARSREPILLPTRGYETKGFVPNVVFPTAMLDHGDEWQVFYGAADTSVAWIRFSKRSVSDSLVATKESQI